MSSIPSNMPYVSQIPIGRNDCHNYVVEVQVGILGSQKATTITVSGSNQKTVEKAAKQIHGEVSKFMRKSSENDENVCDKLYSKTEEKLKKYAGPLNKLDNVSVAIKNVLPVLEKTVETPPTKTEKQAPPPLPPFSGSHSRLPDPTRRPEAPTRPAPRKLQ